MYIYQLCVCVLFTFYSLNAVQNKAARFFLGVGRYTPNAAVNGDTGWTSPIVKQWSSVINNWYRIKGMHNDRINKKVFTWAMSHSGERCKNLCYRIRKQFDVSGISYLYDTADSTFVSKHFIKSEIQENLRITERDKWHEDLNRNSARHGTGGNKLRTYRKFKQVYGTENYVTCLLPRSHRSALAKFRSGVAPLRLETGRYERLAINDRICIFCENQSVESEEHVLLSCTMYDDLRDRLFCEIEKTFCHFRSLPDDDKLSVILGSNHRNVISISAKTCCDILYRRRAFLYK